MTDMQRGGIQQRAGTIDGCGVVAGIVADVAVRGIHAAALRNYKRIAGTQIPDRQLHRTIPRRSGTRHQGAVVGRGGGVANIADLVNHLPAVGNDHGVAGGVAPHHQPRHRHVPLVGNGLDRSALDWVGISPSTRNRNPHGQHRQSHRFFHLINPLNN